MSMSLLPSGNWRPISAPSTPSPREKHKKSSLLVTLSPLPPHCHLNSLREFIGSPTNLSCSFSRLHFRVASRIPDSRSDHREGSIREYQQSSPSERSIASSAPSPVYSTTSSNDSRHLFPWEKRHGSNHPTPPESTNISYESPRVSLDYLIVNNQFRYAVTPPNRLLADAKAHRLAMEGSPNPSSSIWSLTNYPSEISYEHLDEARTSDESRCSTSNLAVSSLSLHSKHYTQTVLCS